MQNKEKAMSQEYLTFCNAHDKGEFWYVCYAGFVEFYTEADDALKKKFKKNFYIHIHKTRRYLHSVCRQKPELTV